MLTGSEILNGIKEGTIEISDFNLNQLNPNSYNLRLGDTISHYKGAIDEDAKIMINDCKLPLVNHSFCLDSKGENELVTEEIPDDGIILYPGILYLAHTAEKTYAKDLIPCISGRSSFARLGMEIHRTAGFGDIGVNLQWTLEITVVHPLKIYKNQEICQIYFEKPDGNTDIQYNGKYQNSIGTVGSRSFMDK